MRDLNPFRPFDPFRLGAHRAGLASLFAPGQPGHWPDSYDPARGRLFQDSAGTTPVTAPDQPVGLVKRSAGTADASQATALSRPTLGRWPRGGRRNMLTYSGDISNAVWEKTKVAVTGFRVTPNTEIAQHRINQTTPLAAGGQIFYADVKAAGYNYTQLRMNTSAAMFNLANGAVESVAGGIAGAINMGDGVWRCWISRTSADVSPIIRINVGFNASTISFAGDGVSGIDVLRAQVENTTVATAYQNVTTDYDITETGVPDVWHLYNDGGDSLPVTLPAGTYGRARVNTDGQVTVDTVVDPTDALSGTRQVDAILRQGAFTAAEEAQIRAYWARYAA